jgi:hypothetical protein
MVAFLKNINAYLRPTHYQTGWQLYVQNLVAHPSQSFGRRQPIVQMVQIAQTAER